MGDVAIWFQLDESIYFRLMNLTEVTDLANVRSLEIWLKIVFLRKKNGNSEMSYVSSSTVPQQGFTNGREKRKNNK